MTPPNYNNPMPDPPRLQREPTKPKRPRRPLLLSLLFWIFLLWTVLGWVRFAQVLLERQFIARVVPRGVALYLLLMGLFLGLMGLPILWGLAVGAHWTLKILWFPAFVFPVIYWFERCCLWVDPNAQANWLFMLLLTLLWFGSVVWVYRAKRIKRFFNKNL